MIGVTMKGSRLGRSIIGQVTSLIMGSFIVRYLVWLIAILYTIINLAAWSYSQNVLNLFIADSLQNTLTLIAAILSVVGLYDVIQKKHTLLRTYPVIGHLRYIFELGSVDVSS